MTTATQHIRNFIASFGAAVSDTEQLLEHEVEQFRGLITSIYGVSHEVAMTAIHQLDILPEHAIRDIFALMMSKPTDAVAANDEVPAEETSKESVLAEKVDANVPNQQTDSTPSVDTESSDSEKDKGTIQ